ncbi:hypothetical protein SASPL_152008 [Salvia splendens]|uniref:Peptidase M10 metallopeptidase domain-containing protein n=1 Tax=Salvia splendens TaxID=180675 RepID=A0A8X8YZL2_SALSN|nr:hypothetical protein SASPL_152008 [Salvia splendens]
MASKIFHPISLIFLIFILLAPIGHAKRSIPSDKNSSPFDFIKSLKGCHKGNNTNEIHELKAYLEKFGYLTIQTKPMPLMMISMIPWNQLSKPTRKTSTSNPQCLQKWDAATHFSFSQVQTNQFSDLVIGFFRGDHQDQYPFDGRGGTLAHAFAPTDGRFHYDADE